jgi:hypothetical protein
MTAFLHFWQQQKMILKVNYLHITGSGVSIKVGA